jgi:DNA adenine methylase
MAMSEITALAGWFGGNRLLAPAVGEQLGRLKWCGVPFAGGMAELPHIDAASILVNDLHRHVINLARVAAADPTRAELIRRLRGKLFHPDELSKCQKICKAQWPTDVLSVDLAEAYFLCCWMGRSGKAGTTDEFNGRTSTRWNNNGGSSVVRYHSAIRQLVRFGRIARRCAFETMDAFEFIGRHEDTAGHGIYCDPPFPGAGRKYQHNAGATDAEEESWHARLATALGCFYDTRVVCRFYEHPLIRRLYNGWTFVPLVGRKQSNEDAAELLVINGPSYAADAQLF